jgi:shikimate kinase
VINFIFTGLKHSGKSTHGRLFAESRGILFEDLDSLVEAEYARNHGKALGCRRIFIEHGEEYFRELERRTVEEFLATCAETPFVLALGGGLSAIPEDLFAICSSRAVLVYLKLPFDVLIRRILEKGIPPFLNADDPESDFRNLYTARSTRMERHAHVVIEFHDEDIQTAGRIIAEKLEGYR